MFTTGTEVHISWIGKIRICNDYIDETHGFIVYRAIVVTSTFVVGDSSKYGSEGSSRCTYLILGCERWSQNLRKIDESESRHS